MNPLSDCKYDKLKLTYKLCKMLHFIDKHAKDDAKKEKDVEFQKTLDEMSRTLTTLVEKLLTMTCK
ncbi:MAG: hypothetical protein NTX86_02070 [Candidatus Dependentiae bacterium]|nr:hypothetical protein [Candidatus Dependentiae bacterium]